MPSTSNYGFVMLAVLVFVAVLLMIESAYLVWRDRRGPRALKLRGRLRRLTGGPDEAATAPLLKQRVFSATPLVHRSLARVPGVDAFDRTIQQAGLQWTVGRVLGAALVLALAGWLTAGSLLHRWPLSAAAAIFLGSVPLMVVGWQRAKRIARIEQQLPDALDLIARALRAGHAFSATLKMAAEELAEPVAGEFRVTHEEINFGTSVQEALTHLGVRVPLTDMRYFVVAVLIQRESGGNLTEILGNLSRLIRERAKLLARVKVLSSEGRLSAWVLTLLPFLLAGALYLANPKFMLPMVTDPLGIAMVEVLLLMMASGVLILRHIIRIRV